MNAIELTNEMVKLIEKAEKEHGFKCLVNLDITENKGDHQETQHTVAGTLFNDRKDKNIRTLYHLTLGCAHDFATIMALLPEEARHATADLFKKEFNKALQRLLEVTE